MKTTPEIKSKVQYYSHHYDPQTQKYVVRYVLAGEPVDKEHVMQNAHVVDFDDHNPANQFLLTLRKNLTKDGKCFVGINEDEDKSRYWHGRKIDRYYFFPESKDVVYVKSVYVQPNDSEYKYDRLAREQIFGKWSMPKQDIADDCIQRLAACADYISDKLTENPVGGVIVTGLLIMGVECGCVAGCSYCINEAYKPEPSDKKKNELRVVARWVADRMMYTDVATGQSIYRLKSKTAYLNINNGDTLVLGFNKNTINNNVTIVRNPVAVISNGVAHRNVYYIKNLTQERIRRTNQKQK